MSEHFNSIVALNLVTFNFFYYNYMMYVLTCVWSCTGTQTIYLVSVIVLRKTCGYHVVVSV